MYWDFFHIRVAPDKQIGLHTQSSFEISYVMKGRGARTMGAVSEPFQEGDLVMVPPGLSHGWSFDPRYVDAGGCIENITFFFSSGFLEHLMDLFPDMAAAVMKIEELSGAVVFSGEKREALARLLLEVDACRGKERAVPVLRLLLLASELDGLAMTVSPAIPGSPARRLEKVRIYLACNYKRAVSIEEVAAYAGMNRSAFCSFFKRHTGTTFISALNAYRVERACEMLTQGAALVEEIAGECGFRDTSYFIKVFKKLKGATPAKWNA